MQKIPSIQINWRGELYETCIHTYQWIELITWASKQPSINTESCKHWNIMRLEHHFFCKHETEDCLLNVCRIYRTDSNSCIDQRYGNKFCTVNQCPGYKTDDNKVLLVEEMWQQAQPKPVSYRTSIQNWNPSPSDHTGRWRSQHSHP